MAKWKGHTICEDEYAYDISLRLAKNLLEHSATVYMITRDPDDGIRNGEYLPCDNDEYCWNDQEIPLNQKKRLQQRTNAINLLYAKHKKQGVKDQKLIIIHIDSRSKRERTDAFFYFQPGSNRGEEIANNLFTVFETHYKREYDGKVQARGLFLLKESNVPAVYVELANIKNEIDQKRLIIESNRIALASWLYEGLVK